MQGETFDRETFEREFLEKERISRQFVVRPYEEVKKTLDSLAAESAIQAAEGLVKLFEPLRAQIREQ